MRAAVSLDIWLYSLVSLSSLGTYASGALHENRRTLLERQNGYGVEDTTTEADFFHFKTRPDIRALKWNITVYDADAVAPGYWFIAPYELLGQKERGAPWIGPYIYDGHGDLVWSGTPLFDSFNIFDFRPIEMDGKHMFTAIYKREDAGVLVDNSYRIQRMIHWPGGYDAANMHEFNLFDKGTKVVMFTLEHHHLSQERSKELGYDGRCSVNTNGLVELDVTKTPPTTLFDWSLLDHISLDEITYPSRPNVDEQCRSGWDANHCNAIDRFDNGDYLISCRHTDAIYKISRESGEILWRLGGTKSDFEFVGNAKFSRQHHARVLEQNETHTVISMLDNARGEGVDTATSEYSRGLILSLNNQRAEIVHEYPRPDHEYSTSRGSLEILPNGNAFIGWTFHSRISEHKPDGTLLMKAKLPTKKNTYRSYKSSWIGRPAAPPDIWSRASGNAQYSTEIYVSWNGATEVSKWNIYESNASGDRKELLETVPKDGFETSVEIDGWLRYVIAEGVDINGRVLGQSKSVQTVPPDRSPEAFVEEQQWLEKNLSPESIGHVFEPPPDPLFSDVDAPEGSDSYDCPDNLDDSTVFLGMNNMEAVSYVTGFVTCLITLVFFWLCGCIKPQFRRRHGLKGYMQVNKEDRADDYELDGMLAHSDANANPTNGSSDYLNGRLHKGEG